MSLASRIVLIVFCCFVLPSGCVPWPRNTLVRPEGTVEVVDAASMQPVTDAKVVLTRFRVGPPPHIVSKNWARTTGIDGKVKFTLLRRREWVYPLMCHGVDQWGWRAHVKKEGYEPVSVTWLVPKPMHDPQKAGRSVPRLVIKITKCNGKCKKKKPAVPPRPVP